MKAHRILLLLLPLLLFGSKCKKAPTSGPTEVSGYTVDLFSGESVPFMPIFLRSYGGQAWGGGGETRITVSDENGFYAFNFEASENAWYEVLGYDLILYHSVKDPPNLKKGVPNQIDITVHPYGWIKLNLKNEPPFDTLYNTHFTNAALRVSIGPLYRDTFLIWHAQGNLTHTQDIYFAGKDGESFTVIRPYVPAHDTVEVSVGY